jgi:phage terminase large subunit-like protein
VISNYPTRASAPRFAPSYRGFCRFCRALGVELLPFQRLIARAVLDGAEREVACVLPRGSLKSTTAALLAVHHIVSTPSPSVYVGAGSKEMARVVGTMVRRLAQHDALAGLLTVRYDEIRLGSRHGETALLIVPSDGARAHGWEHPTLLLADELWMWSDRDPSLLGAMSTSLIKNLGCRLLVISTAAASLDSPLGRMRERALSQPEVHRKGARIDAWGDGLRWLEWSLPDDQDPADFRAVAACNPLRSAEEMSAQHKRVTELEWLQFHCCRWGVGRARWLPVGAWQARRADYTVGADEPITLGIDIGGSRSSTAIIGVTDDLRVATVDILEGREAVLQAVEVIRELAQARRIRQAVYDPMRFESDALRLAAELRVPFVSWPQSETRMTICSERLHAAIVESRLRHPGDRLLDLHVANAEAKPTPRGWRLVKRSDAANIDGTIALAMACEVAEHVQPEVRLIGWG